MEIRIQPSAEKDLDRGFDFYERQEVCLGDYFLETLLSNINKLQFIAGIHAKRGNLFRVKSKTYMRRGSRWIDCRQAARKGEPRGRERVAFPYWIYYRIAESIIYVVAVLDARRSPAVIRKREKKEQGFFYDSNSGDL